MHSMDSISHTGTHALGNGGPDLIIFDCDGVLVDSERITARVFADMLGELGLAVTLQDLFDRFVDKFSGRMFSVTDVTRGKPFPDLFLYAAARFGVPPSRCAVIEDTPTGVSAGVAAGMTVYGYCALTPAHLLTEAGAHRTFDRMERLPA